MCATTLTSGASRLAKIRIELVLIDINQLDRVPTQAEIDCVIEQGGADASDAQVLSYA